jgi:hypothetical protein
MSGAAAMRDSPKIPRKTPSVATATMTRLRGDRALQRPSISFKNRSSRVFFLFSEN